MRTKGVGKKITLVPLSRQTVRAKGGESSSNEKKESDLGDFLQIPSNRQGEKTSL